MSAPLTPAAFNRAALGLSRLYLGLFAVFCLAVEYLDAPPLGWWWIAVAVGGFFLVPVLFVAPMTAISLMLGAKAGVSPYTFGGRLIYLAVDFAGYAALWFATRWALNALA